MIASHCSDPDLAERLLDCARRGGLPLAREHVEHLAACHCCRTSVEQMRRLVWAWSVLEPSAAEVSAARARLAGHAAGRSRLKLAPKTVVLALVLAATAASAAARVVSMSRSPATTPALERPPVFPMPAHDVAAGRPPTPTAEPDAIAFEVLPPAPLHEKGGAPNRRTPSDRVALPSADAGVPAGDASARSNASERADKNNHWAIAAAAMRTGDYAGAERAFDALANASDPYTRDSARLARAQLWLAEGNVAEARRELRDLAATGATDFIRSRAAEALEASR